MNGVDAHPGHFVHQADVVGRTSGTDQTGVRLKVEVEGEGVTDDLIDHRSSREVTRSIDILQVLGKETHSVTWKWGTALTRVKPEWE